MDDGREVSLEMEIEKLSICFCLNTRMQVEIVS
jgi:hypothetical protein